MVSQAGFYIDKYIRKPMECVREKTAVPDTGPSGCGMAVRLGGVMMCTCISPVMAHCRRRTGIPRPTVSGRCV